MQFDIFLILCGHYLFEQNCSKTEVQLLPSLPLAPIFSCYVFKEVPLLARNLESTSLPAHLFLPLSLAEALIYTQTRSQGFICVYQNPSQSIFHSLTEGTSNSHPSWTFELTKAEIAQNQAEQAEGCLSVWAAAKQVQVRILSSQMSDKEELVKGLIIV